MSDRWVREGAVAVELRVSSRYGEADRIGEPVTITSVTDTLVVTSDRERYGRRTLKPIAEGPTSARQLVRPSDNRVLCARGRVLVAEVAQQAGNLAGVDRRDPDDVVAALSQLVVAASDARRRMLALLSEASRAQREARP